MRPTDAARGPRRLRIPLVVVLLAAVVLAGSAVVAGVATAGARAAEVRAAVAEHKLDDADTLLRRADASTTDSDARAAFAALREQVVRDRLAAVTAGAPRALPVVMRDGTHVVGIDVSAGDYRVTATPGRCSYGYLVAGYSNVEPLSDPDGVARVTLGEGDVFRSSGCGLWVRTDR